MRPGKRKNWSRAGLNIILALLFGCSAASSSPHCGSFSFHGKVNTNPGVDAEVAFNFNPSTCGAKCSCKRIIYVQLARFTDIEQLKEEERTGKVNTLDVYAQPNDEQRDRMIDGQADYKLNGWAVDRLPGKFWGFYGMNNDGDSFGTLVDGRPSVTPGSNENPVRHATLNDSTRIQPQQPKFEAVSVPICVDRASSSCPNCLLSGQSWTWTYDLDHDKIHGPTHHLADPLHLSAFKLALDRWNSQPASLNKKPLPDMKPLP